jgi:hypothetical protein
LYFSNLTKAERKIAPIKMIRAAAFFVAIISVVAPIYKLNVALPSFDSLSRFSGSIQEFKLTEGRNSRYILKVSNKVERLTFNLPDEGMSKKLYKQLDSGGDIKVWYARDFMLSLNAYQIDKNNFNIMDYSVLVQERIDKGEAQLHQAYTWFPLAIFIAFLAHVGVILKSNKSLKQDK